MAVSILVCARLWLRIGKVSGCCASTLVLKNSTAMPADRGILMARALRETGMATPNQADSEGPPNELSPYCQRPVPMRKTIAVIRQLFALFVRLARWTAFLRRS